MMSGGPRDREGFTLIGVLVFCMILIPVCASLAQASRDLAFGVGRDLDEAKLEFLGGGVAEAIAAKLSANRNLFDQLNGRWLACSLRETAVAISVRDHDGKIDLNNASSELLIKGFEATGLDSDDARLLQRYVEASRSNVDVPRDISTLVAKVGLKHAPFEHVDELQDALAAIDEPAADLDRLFTVNTGVANVEERTAAPELRTKLATLTNKGVVFQDNGGFDHVDVAIYLRSTSNSKVTAISKTFRKISPLGDVVAIRTARPSAKWPASRERPQADCMRLLGVGGEV
jgi:hypothetical protein